MLASSQALPTKKKDKGDWGGGGGGGGGAWKILIMCWTWLGVV